MTRTRTFRARTAAFAAIASLSLIAAACGNDDDNSGSEPAATEAAGTIEPMATEPMATEPMSTEPMATDSMTSDGGDMMGATARRADRCQPTVRAASPGWPTTRPPPLPATTLSCRRSSPR